MSSLSRRRMLGWSIAATGSLATGCSASRMVGGNLASIFSTPREVTSKVDEARVPGARLSVLWVGHATMLVQLGDVMVMTDPVFTSTVGLVSRRLVEPGLDIEAVPPLDAVLISHMHFDHLSYGSLSDIEDKVGVLVVPSGAEDYVPRYDFAMKRLRPWGTWQSGGLTVTAVPVDHLPWRYGVDEAWGTGGFTGYLIEHDGVRVYFGGDTAYSPDLFREVRRRFEPIDLALLPIGPIEPRAFMKGKHTDPAEALDAYRDLGAKWMVPMHFDTFFHGDDPAGSVTRSLRLAMKERALEEGKQIHVLEIGERRVLE